MLEKAVGEKKYKAESEKNCDAADQWNFSGVYLAMIRFVDQTDYRRDFLYGNHRNRSHRECKQPSEI
jgi:hypothetical protein